MNPKNIQEFVAYKAIEYLKERDEEIKQLKRELSHLKELFEKSSETVTECVKCEKWIDYIRDDESTYWSCECCRIECICEECGLKGSSGFSGFNDEIWHCPECNLQK